MKKTSIVFGALIIVLFSLFGMSQCNKKNKDVMLAKINSIEALKRLFSHSPQEIDQRTKVAIDRAKVMIQDIIAVPCEQRTFENTARALDRLLLDSGIEPVGASCAVLREVSPDAALRNVCTKKLQELSEFEIDWIAANIDLYRAFKEYKEQADLSALKKDELYFLEETMKDFERSGLNLPKKQLDAVKALQKELADLSLQFSGNISADQSEIVVEKKDLQGLDDDFIGALPRDEKGLYRVAANMPNYQRIMQGCSVEETRKNMYRTFRNRAYPVNVSLLENIIAKRDRLARLLGFDSYASLNLDSQMIKTPKRAEAFLNTILVKLNKKEQQEFDALVQDLPESVTLTHDGKLKPWDILFVQTAYKKKQFAIDEQALAEYFKLETTLEKMFALYERFFNVGFEEVQASGFWHEEVKLVKVYNADTQELISYLLLDLHPRPNKYGHAAMFGVIPGVVSDSESLPSVSFVVANFPKSTATKPSLLQHSQVETLFHEFGHAMHHVLGRTHLVSQAGTATTTDFVEVPSQMLEDWLWDKEVLINMTAHYKTGEPLSEQVIDNLIASQQFDRGYFWQRQSLFSLLSLDYFGSGEKKDLAALFLKREKEIMRNLASDDETHFYASFGHLTGYGARYYGYLWSKVLSVDVFEAIKKHGLLRDDAGKKYVETILSKGGSQDPNDMIKVFLGREPDDVAFCKHMGL